MVIDPGQRLRLAAIGEEEPADNIHLPQLHRLAPFPPPPRLLTPTAPARLDHSGPGQAPVDRRLRHRHPPACQLDADPPRPPARVRAAHLQHPRRELRRHLMRTPDRPVRPVRQTLQTLSLIPSQPRMQRLPAHPPLPSHLSDRPTLADHRENRLIPLLGHAHLPHAKGVSTISRSSCQGSAEDVSTISRCPNVRHQPKVHKMRVGQAGLEPATEGL